MYEMKAEDLFFKLIAELFHKVYIYCNKNGGENPL